MLPAYKTYSFNLGYAPLTVTQTDTFHQLRAPKVKRAHKGQNLTVFYPDQLLFHIKAECQPVRHISQFPHKCL